MGRWHPTYVVVSVEGSGWHMWGADTQHYLVVSVGGSGWHMWGTDTQHYLVVSVGGSGWLILGARTQCCEWWYRAMLNWRRGEGAEIRKPYSKNQQNTLHFWLWVFNFGLYVGISSNPAHSETFSEEYINYIFFTQKLFELYTFGAIPSAY